MVSSGHAKFLNRERIIAIAQERKTGKTPNAPGEEETIVSSRADDAERILSKPVKSRARQNRRKRRHGSLVAKVGLLGIIVIAGIAVVIGLRYLAEAFGVNWIGD